MNLQTLINEGASRAINTLSQDSELTNEIQRRLGELGILDPPADGAFGPQSRNALRLFGKTVGIAVTETVEAGLATKLLSADADTLFPLAVDSSLASRILQYMQLKNYWIARPPGYLNIVYVEGMDQTGELNVNQPNEFNDRRMIISIEDGRPSLIGTWEATTEPGKYYTLNPPSGVAHLGVARIEFGQYKSWHVGTHHGLSGTDNQEALVQAANITICRDLDKNYKRLGDRRYPGTFAINQHGGHGRPLNDIGRVSAGCLVGRTDSGHQQFMQIVKSDPRYGVSHGYKFMTTVISGEDMMAQLG